MKRNIDLTERRIFSIERITSAIIDILGVTFLPWDYAHIHEVQSDYEPSFALQYNALILCGTASERQRMRECQMYDDGRLCERCGTKIPIKPWQHRYCLCQRCYDDLEKDISPKWRYKNDPAWDSENFVVAMMNRR